MPAHRLLAFTVLAVALGACAIRRHADALDVNGAPVSALAALPGLGEDDAERIATHRPYWKKADLVARKVLTARQYEQVEDDLYVGAPAMPEYFRPVPPVTW